MPSNDRLKCSFCGKTQDQVKKLIAGPDVFICDECVGTFHYECGVREKIVNFLSDFDFCFFHRAVSVSDGNVHTLF